MPHVESPMSFVVDTPYDRCTYLGQEPVVTFTDIFRETAHSAEALTETYMRIGDSDRLSIDVMGCSNGAELFSLIALHNYSGHGARVTARGYDVHPTAIEQARNGRLILPYGKQMSDIHERTYAGEVLTRYGFKVDIETVHLEPGSWFYGGKGYKVDANSLLEGHDVTFIQYNLADGTPSEGQTDLISANNLFYHMRSEKATRILLNIAPMVGRVLNMGGINEPDEKRMNYGDPNEVPYYYWLTEVAAPMLEEEFGLKPITTELQDEPLRPAMFARD